MVDIPLNTATFNEEIVVVTSNFVPGYKVLETRGFVYGLTVRSRGVGGQIGAGVRSVFGGEIKEYVTMMEDSRNQALERMIAHARSMGANAIISSRFDSDQISNIMQEILAYGTAVIIEKEEESS
ncbi:MAG: heavy metal-binding domain-containing protein [Methanobacteriaceae archaeon]|nr:heavy metal-binding domain-containing protein [Methanobacteriaceae archaeon]MDZ4171991.1 heavy metal-binding domain-containing protein [Methanobacteriaceae archaeon]